MDKIWKILVVEDELGIAKMVEKRLKSEGYAVTLAENGEDALKKAEAFDPDIVLLDVMLPKLSGYDVCRRLKQNRQRVVPVILLSAMAQEADIKRGFECGADAYVRKPFRTHELLSKIREFIGSVESDKEKGETLSHQ